MSEIFTNKLSIDRGPFGVDLCSGNECIAHFASSGDDALDNKRRNLLRAAPELLEALKQATQDCGCTVAERMSGHRTECRAPEWIELIARATT